MKAAVCHEFDSPLVIEDIQLEPPHEHEVQIRVKACGICHSDIHYLQGEWGGKLPAVYGHEAAGVVESVGPGVANVAVGDRVIATLLRSCGECFYCMRGSSHLCEGSFAIDHQCRLRDTNGVDIKQGLRAGAFAEMIVVEQSQVAPIPSDVPYESAALLGCGVLTGWGAVVNSAELSPDSSAAVLGVGGVGLNVLQGAALHGATPLLAVDRVPYKLTIAPDFGATHVLNPAEENEQTPLRKLTDGRGFDYVFVTVGHSEVITQGLRLLRAGGVLVLVGMPATGDLWQLEASELANLGQQIRGSKMGSASVERDIPRLIELYQTGRFKLDELISGVYPLEEINHAIASVKQGNALRNVIVF